MFDNWVKSGILRFFVRRKCALMLGFSFVMPPYEGA